MNEAKDVTVNNSSPQTIEFKATWSGGEGPDQRVPMMGLARVDMRGVPKGATVTLAIRRHTSIEFKFNAEGGHGECIVQADGKVVWNAR